MAPSGTEKTGKKSAMSSRKVASSELALSRLNCGRRSGPEAAAAAAAVVLAVLMDDDDRGEEVAAAEPEVVFVKHGDELESNVYVDDDDVAAVVAAAAAAGDPGGKRRSTMASCESRSMLKFRGPSSWGRLTSMVKVLEGPGGGGCGQFAAGLLFFLSWECK